MASRKRNSSRHRSNQNAVATRPQGDVDEVVGAPLQVTTTTTRQVFSGPLPPPNVLAGYNNVVPNAAERIVAMAESEQKHRHAVEAAAVNANIAAQERQIAVAELQTKSTYRSDLLGQVLGFLVAIICFALATFFGIRGNTAVAAMFLGPTVAAVIVAMLNNGRRSDKSQEKK